MKQNSRLPEPGVIALPLVLDRWVHGQGRSVEKRRSYRKHALLQGTCRSIEEFAGSNIPFENVMVNWLKKYEKWLLDNGKSYATVGFCPVV